MAGALLGFLGITVAGMAIVKGSFWFCMGLVMAADANSFVQQYRFAASDYVQDTIKSQAFSGTHRWYRGWHHRPPAGHVQQRFFISNSLCWRILGGSALLVIGFLVLILLPPQIPETRKTHRKEGRTRREFVQDQTFVTAGICGTSSYALMAFVMTAAPLAIVGCGFGVAEAAVGIQWHVLAMVVPSLFTGKLISHSGKLSIIAAGLVLLCFAQSSPYQAFQSSTFMLC